MAQHIVVKDVRGSYLPSVAMSRRSFAALSHCGIANRHAMLLSM